MVSDENIRFSRATRFRDVRLLHARFCRFRFAPHFHYCYSIGVVTDGLMRFEHRDQHGVAQPLSITLVNPGEVHAGQSACEEGWSFRSFYVGETVLGDVAKELYGPDAEPPTFLGPIVDDPGLADRLVRLHRRLESSPDLMEQECSFLSTMGALITTHSGPARTMPEPSRERIVVRHARRLIEERFAEDLSLSVLADEVELSPFHLLRVFRAEVGLTPHKYLVQVRVRHARALLSAGCAIADTSLACGFVDQSHLTRHFKRILGVTPGCFRQSCSGSAPFDRSRTVTDWLELSRRRSE